MCFYIFLPNTVISEDLKQVSIFLLRMDNDFEQKIRKKYTGIVLEKKFSQERAIKMALKENKIKLKNLNIRLESLNIIVSDAQDAIKQIKQKSKPGSVIILDIPFKIMSEILRDMDNKSYVFINARNRNVSLREEYCKVNLFHTIPSERMYADSLSQFLITNNWKDIIVLYGDSEKDLQALDSLLKSGKKFGLKIKSKKKFSLSKNPKDRDSNNSKTITGGASYDAIIIFDDHGEYSRTLPFNTFLPRPIMGQVGLMPKAWHWSWERYGAPQLNQRFDRKINFTDKDNKKRNMLDTDWAAWAAIKAIVEALKLNSKKPNIKFNELFRNKNLNIDLYKGSSGSFRNWNNQLRQPILLTTHNAVISKMPNEKFLHREFIEDTIGIDKQQSECVF